MRNCPRPDQSLTRETRFEPSNKNLQKDLDDQQRRRASIESDIFWPQPASASSRTRRENPNWFCILFGFSGSTRETMDVYWNCVRPPYVFAITYGELVESGATDISFGPSTGLMAGCS